MSLSVGSHLGPYEVVDLLGAGAMGEVYRAHDHRLQRQVAMKVLPARIADDIGRLRRFEIEARAAGALNHPNIVAIHDVGSDGGARYVVSELLDGQTLRERCDGSPLPTRKVLDYAIQIARGLSAAHAKGIVHRDLKPENLFITRDGAVKILDFGLAKLASGPALGTDDSDSNSPTNSLTEPGTVLGTIGYMSPEQVRGEPVDHRSDIFALGAIVYEMLTGQRAFRGRSAVETMNAILKEEPPPIAARNPAAPIGLERVVAHCLEKGPDERFQSARDLAFDLEALSHPSGVSGRALVPPAARGGRGLRAASAGLLLLALPTAGFFAGRGQAAPLRPEFHRVSFRRGTVTSARFSHDGQVLYSAAWEGNPVELYTVRPESPDSRLMGFRDARVMAVSGSELALAQGADARDDAVTTLARAPLAGGPPRAVESGVIAADWARDGSFALLRHANGQQALEYPGGRQIYSGMQLRTPRISPNGALVAFLEGPVQGDDRGHVAVVDKAGVKSTLSGEWASLQGLAWSPDGREVWFTAAEVGAESALHAVTLDGRARLITKVPGRLVLHDIAPDGRVLLERNSNRLETKGRFPGDAVERDLSWFDYTAAIRLSADARELLFYESGEGGGRGYGIYLRPTSGELPVKLGEGRATDLSPDGRWVLAIPPAAPDTLMLLPTGAGQPRALGQPGLGYLWAGFFPDAERILITARAGQRPPRLYVQALAGGALRALTPEGVGMQRNLISPDGREVIGFRKDAGYAIFDVESGVARAVPHLPPQATILRWGGDGRSLLIQSGDRPVTISRLDLTSGRQEPLHRLEPLDPAGIAPARTEVTLTADGQAYAYTALRKLSDLYVVDGLK